MSHRFKHSVKTALAITLASGLALWFNWDNPKWAAFAVGTDKLNAGNGIIW